MKLIPEQVLAEMKASRLARSTSVFASDRVYAVIDYLEAAIWLADTPVPPPPQTHLVGWTKVPDEPTLEFLKSINVDNQVLAYENGRYYNAWFTFEPGEGGWFWTDDADSEPNPSHYRPLREVALAATAPEPKP